MKKFKLVLVVCLLFSMIASMTIGVQALQIKTNVALGKTATSNRADSANNRTAADLTDGVTNKYAAGNGAWYMHKNYTEAEDNYIEIDLGGNYTISSAVIRSGSGDASVSETLSSFTIYYYDDSEYKAIPGAANVGEATGNQKIQFSQNVTTNKIKIIEHLTVAYRIREIEIYGVFHSALPTNIALGKTATSNRADSANNRTAADLTDGVTNKYAAGDGAWYMHKNYTEAEDNYIEIDLDGNYTINSAVIRSGSSDASVNETLSSFTIYYYDGSEYKAIPGAANVGEATGNQKIQFSQNVTTNKIKIIEHLTVAYRIREIEIYGVFHSALPTNIALGKTATSNKADAANNRKAADLTDGVTSKYTAGDGAWYMHQNYTETEDNYIEIDLGGNYTISRAKIYSGYFDTEAAGGNKLTDYTIMYQDGGEYKTVPGGVVEGANHGIYEVNFESSVVTDKIKIVENMTTHYRIREIEIYGVFHSALPTNIALGKTATSNRADSANNRTAADLTDGVTNKYAAGDGAWYMHKNYTEAEDNYIEIDLGGNYTISSAVIRSGSGDASVNETLSDFTIYYYENFEYKVIPGAENAGEATGNQKIQFSQNVTTNKIKIIEHLTVAYRIREIEIYGISAPSTPPAINNLVNFFDEEGNGITAYGPGDTIVGKVDLSIVENDVTCMMAVKEQSGRVLDADVADEISADCWSASVTVPANAENTYIEFYIWENGNNRPLAEKTIYYSPDKYMFTGRWEQNEDGVFVSNFGAAYVETTFSGNTAKVNMAGDANNFAVTVDGVSKLYRNAYGLIDVSDMLDLNEEFHNIRVTSKYYNDNIKFKGFVFDDTSDVSAPEEKPLIEFIGDSITAGFQSSNAINEENFTAATYGYLCAERLGYNHTHIARPGITLSSGSVIQTRSMPELYKYTRASDSYNVLWDLNLYAPDIIVINLGTNDAGSAMNPVPTAEEFKESYLSFLNDLRGFYPDAEIFALRCFNGVYADATSAAVTEANDSKMHYVDTTGWIDESTGYADAVHPNNAGHQRAADELYEAISDVITAG